MAFVALHPLPIPTSTSAARSSSTSRAARWRPTVTWTSAWFGQNAILDAPAQARLKVGDAVRIELDF